MNTQPCDKYILSSCVNCTSKILLQSILKPFSIGYHIQTVEFIKDRERVFIWISLLYTQSFTHTVLLKGCSNTNTYLINHHLGLLCWTHQQRNTLRISKQRYSTETTTWMLLLFSSPMLNLTLPSRLRRLPGNPSVEDHRLPLLELLLPPFFLVPLAH